MTKTPAARVPQRPITDAAAERIARIADRRGLSQAAVFHALVAIGGGRKSAAKIAARRAGDPR